MEISQFSFILLAAYSFGFGVLLGVIYDTIRILRVLLGVPREKKGQIDFRNIELPIIKRKVYPTKSHKLLEAFLNVWVAVGDIIFAISCGALAVMVSFAYNSGKVRAVIFVGLLLGFVVYYFTLGKLVMKASELVAFLIRSAVVYACEFVRIVCAKLKIKKIRKKGAKNDIRQQDQRSKKKMVAG